jgi:hypothetical protein
MDLFSFMLKQMFEEIFSVIIFFSSFWSFVTSFSPKLDHWHPNVYILHANQKFSFIDFVKDLHFFAALGLFLCNLFFLNGM